MNAWYRCLYRLKEHARDCRLIILAGSIGLLCVSLLGMPLPQLTGQIIDKVFIGKGSVSQLYSLLLLMLGISIARYLVSIASKHLFVKTSVRVVNSIRLAMLDKAMDLPMSYYDENEKGYILSRVSECSNVGNLFMPANINIFIGIFDFIFAFIMLCRINLIMTALVVLVFPIYFYAVRLSSDALSKSIKGTMETGGVVNGEVFEAINGVQEIKILNGKSIQLAKIKKKLEDLIKISVKQGNHMTVYFENMMLINALSGMLVLLLAGILIIRNEMTIGMYTAFAGYVAKIFGNVQSLASIGITLKPIFISIDRVGEFMDTQDENQGKTESLDNEQVQKISIRDIYFKYSKSNSDSISGFSCTINAGDKVLIKGRNGAGKTTLVKLLLGLYNADKGDIYYNDKAVSTIDRKSLRHKISVVSQNIYLIKGTVLDNILFNVNGKTERDVMKLIEKYNLGRHLLSLKGGLNTDIGHGGANVSGGQKQLIAFLRALISDKEIIVLDEPTSNMDIEIKTDMINIIKNNSLCKMLLIISHDEAFSFVEKSINLDSLCDEVA